MCDDPDEDQLREETASDFIPSCAAWRTEDEIAYAAQFRGEAASDFTLPDDTWHSEDEKAYAEQLLEEAQGYDGMPYSLWEDEVADAEHARLDGFPDCDDDDGGDDDGGGGGGLPLPAPTASAAGKPNPRAKETAARAERIIEYGKLLHDQSERWFAYDEINGCFSPVRLDQWLESFFGEESSGMLAKDFHELEEKLLRTGALCCLTDEFNRSSDYINLSNGVFNLKTGELEPHDPKFRFTYRVKANYLMDGTSIACPAFMGFCQTSLNGDPIKRQTLLEFIGYSLCDSTAGKCALFLLGQPNSGKSIIAALLRHLLDDELVASVQLHQLGDRFNKAELAGKKLNVAGEIAGKTLNDISIFKAATGGDRIMGEFKGCNPFYFVPRCKHVFAGNTLPLTTDTDATAAFVNRVRVLLFNVSIPEEQQDKNLLDKLLEERDSIVTLALRALRKLAERNYEFTMPEDSKRFLMSFKVRGNIVGGFIEDCCVLNPNARVFNDDLYDAFETYCVRNGWNALKRHQLYELLSGYPHVGLTRFRMQGENKNGHLGIRLKTPEELTEENEKRAS